MKPEEQRIAIAEACGWRIVTTIKYVWVVINPQNMECAWSIQAGIMNDRPASHYLPNYLNDLNAMHEAEKVLTRTRGQQEEYDYQLSEIVAPITGERWLLLHATARQRAEAFLRTLNLWTE